MRNRLLARSALLLAVASLACDGSEPLSPEQVPGRYELVTISGHPVPFVRRQARSDPSCLRAGEMGALLERINSGTLEIDDGSAFELEIRVARICTYDDDAMAASYSELTIRGEYRVESGQLLLDPADTDRETIEVRHSGSRLTIGLVATNDIYRDYTFEPSELGR